MFVLLLTRIIHTWKLYSLLYDSIKMNVSMTTKNIWSNLNLTLNLTNTKHLNLGLEDDINCDINFAFFLLKYTCSYSRSATEMCPRNKV